MKHNQIVSGCYDGKVVNLGMRLKTFMEKNRLLHLKPADVLPEFQSAMQELNSDISLHSVGVIATGKPKCKLLGESVIETASITHNLGECRDQAKVDTFIAAKIADHDGEIVTLNHVAENQRLRNEIADAEAAEAKAKADAEAAAEKAKAEAAKAKAAAAK
jgi:hypothetical protein